MSDANVTTGQRRRDGEIDGGASGGRNVAIDRLRGVLVILMVIGNYLGGIAFVPAFLKHAPDIGFTVADVVAPLFVFLIGLNFGPSFERRMSDGRGVAIRHVTTRYLALIGIGAVISAGSNLVGKPSDWGVLQAIGVAGLTALAVIRFPVWARFLAGSALLIGYQFVLDASMLATVLGSAHGGFFGSLSWAALLVLSTAVADIWRKGMVPYLVCVAVLALVATLSTLMVPVSKNRVSLSYILITLTISALAFLVAEVASRIGSRRAGYLTWWGKHALAMYLFHLIVLAPFVSLPLSWWYVDAPEWLAGVQLVVILGVLSLIARWLEKRHRHGGRPSRYRSRVPRRAVSHGPIPAN